MLRIPFFFNPIRKNVSTVGARIRLVAKSIPVRLGLWCGFLNIDYAYVHGQKSRIHLGENCSTMNTLFNVICGDIFIGDNTIFGHNCMVLTGTHEFFNGIRGSLHKPPREETPQSGRDIKIGAGCFIGSNAIILGKVTIGDNVVIGAGSVVTKDIPSDCIAAGAPAKIVKMHDKETMEIL